MQKDRNYTWGFVAVVWSKSLAFVTLKSLLCYVPLGGALEFIIDTWGQKRGFLQIFGHSDSDRLLLDPVEGAAASSWLARRLRKVQDETEYHSFYKALSHTLKVVWLHIYIYGSLSHHYSEFLCFVYVLFCTFLFIILCMYNRRWMCMPACQSMHLKAEKTVESHF